MCQILSPWLRIISPIQSLKDNLINDLESESNFIRHEAAAKNRSWDNSWCKFRKKWSTEWQWIIQW